MAEKKSLIYLAVFINPDFINLVELLLTSLKLYGGIDLTKTDLMVITDEGLKPKVDEVALKLGLPIQYYYLSINTKWQSSAARLEIFQNEHIDNYDTILYVDTDVLVNKNINTLLNLPIRDDKLYALGEGQLGSVYWGGQFFNFDGKPYNFWTEAFCAGILLFKNSPALKDLFSNIKFHIHQYVFVENNPPPDFWEQPFVVYNAVIEDKYDNQLLKRYVVNNKFYVEPCDLVLYHFPCGPGWYSLKYENMLAMADQQREFYHPEVLPELKGLGANKSKNWVSFMKPGQIKPFKYLEIGVFCGHTIVTFERIFGRHSDTRLYGIDTWNLLNKEYEEKYDQASNYNHCLTNIINTGRSEKFDLRKGFSHIEIPRFEDNFFDVIYIDGNHSSSNVMEDAVLSFRKLKVGGFLIFSDYYSTSIKKAVDTFCTSYSEKLSWLGISCGENFFKKC